MTCLWIKVMFLALLSAKASGRTFFASGEILDHLEMIFISIMGNNNEMFEKNSMGANIYFVEKYLENDCNFSLCANVTMGKFFGIEHRFDKAVERNFSHELMGVLYLEVESLINGNLTESEIEILKLLKLEEFEEITPQLVDPVIEFLMTRKIKNKTIQAFMENVRHQDIPQFPCGADYSLYEGVYREFLQTMKSAFRSALYMQMSIGFRKYTNARILLPQIMAKEMISMNDYLEEFELSKRPDQNWFWTLIKNSDGKCDIGFQMKAYYNEEMCQHLRTSNSSLLNA